MSKLVNNSKKKWDNLVEVNLDDECVFRLRIVGWCLNCDHNILDGMLNRGRGYGILKINTMILKIHLGPPPGTKRFIRILLILPSRTTLF